MAFVSGGSRGRGLGRLCSSTDDPEDQKHSAGEDGGEAGFHGEVGLNDRGVCSS